MFPNRFSLNIALRVILITANSLVFITVLTRTGRPATTVFFGLLLVVLAWNLYHYVNRTNRQLANFIATLKEKDTSAVFAGEHLERTFRGITVNFQRIIDEIRESRMEKEAEQQKIHMLIEQVPAGIMAFDHSGRVKMINNAAMKMLSVHALKHTDELVKYQPQMAGRLKELRPGHPVVCEIRSGDKTLHLSLRAGHIKSRETLLTIISLQDIREELEARELDSWKKLIRVITHEIMNSITPVTTLTTAIRRSLSYDGKPKDASAVTGNNIQDALRSTVIIEERSKGLISFIERSRSVTRLPQPRLTEVPVKKLFLHLQTLLGDECCRRGIRLQFNPQPEYMTVKADEKLTGQVLINLIKNAMEVLKGQDRGSIAVRGEQTGNTKRITVTDNGPGISPELLDQVFTPYFTTKENGEGLGLSICREIMRMQGGSISVQSEPGTGTTFLMNF